MRIGIDGLPLTEPLAGIGHYTLEVARRLANNSAADQVEVISPRAFIADLQTQDSPRLVFTRIRVNLLTRQWWSIGLPRYIRKHSIDVFHGTNFEVPLLKACPTVLTIHDLSLLLYPETHKRRRVARARGRLPLMAKRATMIITDTDSVRREVHEHLHIPLEKIVTVSLAPRETFRRLESGQTDEVRKAFGLDGEFLLYVGTIEPRKNPWKLVAAFSQVSQKRKTLKLVLAGIRGWLVDDFMKALDHSAAKQNVIVTGYLDDEQLCALYSSCSLFVYPSLYEGFGLPPLEAMACGAPVLASKIPSIAEVVGTAARLIDPLDVDQIARTIEELLDNGQLRNEMVQAGTEHVKEFSWERTCEQSREVYREAIARFR
jgi:alpha-1,3-rhamnosyl/mannosyltransferase